MTEFYDFMGQPLAIGDFVITQAADHVELECLVIIKFTPKKVRIKRLNCKRWASPDFCRDAKALCKIDSELVTMYILKNSQNEK